jgi:phage terminase small subunit
MKKRVKAGTSKASAAQRRALFVEAMTGNGGNKYQAAVAAGFPEGEAAKKAATRLSEDVRVREAIEKRRAEAVAKAGLSVERTLLEVARLAYSDVRKLYKPDGSLIPVHELDDDAAATVASVEVDEIGMEGVVVGHTKKIKHWDKNSALEKAMKHLGLYEKDNAQRPVLPERVLLEFVEAKRR